MSEYVRVATFEVDGDALDALVARIRADENPPDGVAGRRITILADRAAGKALVAIRFDSEDDLRAGAAVLDGMEPPDVGSRRRACVDAYEVVLERGF
jgi:hypothetical protein